MRIDEGPLGGTQLIVGIQGVCVLGVPFEHHQALEIEDQVRSFIEPGKHRERFIEFLGPKQGVFVAGCSLIAQLDQAQDRGREHVADTGDQAARAAANDAVHDLGIDTHHQLEVGSARRDVLGRIVEGFGAAELLEADQVVELLGQVEEQLGPGLEAVVGTVVDDGGKLAAVAQHRGEVRALGGGRSSAGEHAGNDHEAGGAGLAGVARQGGGARGALGTGADDYWNVLGHQRLDTFPALAVGKKRPFAHGPAIDHAPASRHRRVPRPLPRAYRNPARHSHCRAS